MSINSVGRAPLLWLVAPFMCGLLYAALFPAGNFLPWVLGGVGALGVACLTLWKTSGSVVGPWSVLWACAYVLGGFSLGVVLMRDARQTPSRWAELPPREVDLVLRVDRVFAAPEGMEARSGIGRILAVPLPVDDLEGQRVHFSLRGGDHGLIPVRGQRLHLRGVIHPLDRTGEAEGFQDFLLRSGVYFQLRRAHALDENTAPRPPFGLYHALSLRMETLLRPAKLEAPERPPAVLQAMLLGRRALLHEEEREVFLRTGTMHFFAISGLHIGVIAVCLHMLARLCRVPIRWIPLLGLPLLFIFVQATGGTPSAMRAFLMTAVFWSARSFFRPSNPFAALVTSALLVLVWDPMQWQSASFQFSYAVVTAILLYALPLQKLWSERYRHWRSLGQIENPRGEGRDWGQPVPFVLGLLTISLSATLVATPLVISNFGIFTPGAICINMVMVPVVSLAIVGGFLALLTGLAGVSWLSWVFLHASWLLLDGVVRLLESLVRLPGVYWEAHWKLPWFGPATTLGLLILLWIRARGSLQKKATGWFLPWIALGLALLLGLRLS